MKLLVATLFLSGVLSAPFSMVLKKPTVPRCNKDGTHFHTKKSLLYSYEGETISGLVGTSEVRSGLKLRAKCQVTPVLPCMYMLQILEAELLEGQGMNENALDFKLSSGSKDLSRELKARDLYFESHEGVITNIRHQSGEPVYVLNIKRGILSSLQLKIVDKDRHLTEADVSGECTANYQIKARHNSGRVKTVFKKKDLSLCKDRSNTNLGIPVTNYPTEKPFSLLKSSSLCKFAMTPKQRIGKVSCVETHLFRPFSSEYNSSSGAITKVRQNLALIGHKVLENTPSMPTENKQASLKYEHVKEPEKTMKNHKEVEDILDKLGAEEGTQPDTARLFTKLIFAMRRLNTKALKYVWYTHYDCLQRRTCTKGQSERYQKFIVDGLSQCGTFQCSEFMITIIKQEKVSTPQSVQFLTGIALVGEPSDDMVGNILYFCQETPSRTAFLTLGTLMHKYCSQHSCDNLNSRSLIYQADKFLQSKLSRNCQTSTTDELEPITLALKAIGNAGRPYTAVDNILKCAVVPGPSFIHIDALQALRRMPCSEELSKGLLNIFDDLTMDTEVRIEAYLALIRCSNKTVIQAIADVLDTEKNNQVGSFVWTHMTNALESTEPVYGVPLRDAISQALEGRTLRAFNLDHLRYSHVYEMSHYSKKYEVGGTTQSQVVFHPESYFPRSVKFNFTVDVLGASVNLLETAARFEGFETLVEQMFGPEGYFPDDRLMQLLKIKPTEAMSRRKRSANEVEMNEIKSNLEKLQDKMKIERKNPTGALSLKVFGHELQFLSFKDIDWLQGEADSINVIDTLINIARGGKITYTKSFLLLEADHVIPTALGVPLKLAVNGSGVSSVTLKGKFDIRNMFWGKKKFDVRGFVTPSATIDISGKMTVDAIHASSGIQVNASLHTSTEINGNATYQEGEGIKLSVEPPTKPVYIVNVKSNLATFLNEKREKISGSPRRFEHKNCANFTRFLGVNLCGHVSLPMAYRDYNSPYFPLSGDASFGMTFETTNPELARFEVETRTLTSEDENRHDWIFSVHVPGLTFGRKVVGNSTFQFLDDGKYLSVSCGIQDYKFGKFEAKYNNVTNRLQTKLSTPNMAYLRPITIETEIFNTINNDTNTQDVGIAINASYSNFTITDVVSLHKNKDRYKIKSKFTYWPGKHITSEAQFSMEKRMVYFRIDDSNSMNKFYFAGKLGKNTNRFTAKIGNDFIKKEIKVSGELNTKNKKLLVDIITKPSGHIVEFVAYPRWNALENGFYMKLSHLNSSSFVNGYLGSSNMKRESILKVNGVFMKKPFLLRTSHYVLSTGKKVECVAQGFGNKANASLEYAAKRWSKNNVEFVGSLNGKTIKAGVFLKTQGIGAYMNDQTVELQTTYKNEDRNKGVTIVLQMNDQLQNRKKLLVNGEYAKNDEETALTFTLDGSGYKNYVAWSFYHHKTESGLKMEARWNNLAKQAVLRLGIFEYDNEKGLRIHGNILDKEYEVKWSILSGDQFGVKFSALYMKKEVILQSTWMTDDLSKEWRIDVTYNNKTASLVSTYRPNVKYLCSEIIGLTSDRVKACLQIVNNDGERSLRVLGEGVGKTAEMKAGWINKSESKGVILQMSYDKIKISDFFVGLVTSPSYTGLRLKGTVQGKTLEAILKYKTTPLKRSLDLDIIVQGKLVTFESMLVRDPSLKGVQIKTIYGSKVVGSFFALFHNKSSANIFKIGGKGMNYGAEYKLSLSKSKTEKKLSSIVIFTARSTHYKYGYSVSHSNKGTNGRPNHIITTRFHYAMGKVLTSIYQFVNSEQILSMLSKMEIAPGQVLNNKIAYYKKDHKLSVKYEMLPGIGLTYLAAFINDDKFVGVQSNLTVMEYPINSLAMLNRRSGIFTCKLSYSPVRPPVEFTTYLRRHNGIDFAITLSALDQVWGNNMLIDYTTKQLQINVNVLPYVPISVFAKILQKNEFVLNMTTCSAFSAELSGIALNEEEYQLVVKHKFRETVFEDFKLSISSLKRLNKLRLGWESKAGKEMMKTWNATMQTLSDASLSNLANLSESARNLANDTINYLRHDGRDKLLAVVNQSKEKVLSLKDMVMDLEINNGIKKYSVRASELLSTLKRDILELVGDIKNYGTPFMEVYEHLERTVKDISSQLSPLTKSFTADLEEWVSRTAGRYLALSICGKSIQEMINIIEEKTQNIYATVKANFQEHAQRYMMKFRKLKLVFKDIEDLAQKAKETVEDFTCKYNLECTKNNVGMEVKKLVNRTSLIRLFERFKKSLTRLTVKFKEAEKYILLTIEEKHLQERAIKVLQPIINILKNVTRTLRIKALALEEKVEDFVKRSSMTVHYNKIKDQYKELSNAINKVMVYTTNNMEVVKKEFLNHINSVKTMKEKTLTQFQKIVELTLKLKKMSWEEIQVYSMSEIEVNPEKMKEKVIALRRIVLENIELFLERHANEVDQLKMFGKKIYATYDDIINGRVTVQDAKEKLRLLLKVVMDYIKEQKLQAVNKIKALKLDEAVTKAYKSAAELYRKTREDLGEKVTALYPEVIKELEKLLLKVKKVAVKYVDLAKLKLVKLRSYQEEYLKEAMNTMLDYKEILVKKVYELHKEYKKYGLEVFERLKTEIIELRGKYKELLDKAAVEYKTKLLTTVEKVRMEVRNTLKSYKDKPIEDIYLKLQEKVSEALDELLGFIIGETLTTYKEVMAKVKEIKEFYQSNRKMLEGKWKEIKNVIEELNVKYRALAVENYNKASVYYQQNIQFVNVTYFVTLKDAVGDVLFVSVAKLEQLKLWYEHMKYIKFKEFYNNVKDHLEKYDFSLKEYCEKRFYVLVEEIKSIKAKIEDFINEVKEESKIVIQRIEQINKDTKRDAIETFKPYLMKVRNVLDEHKSKTLKKFAPLNEKYENIRNLLAKYGISTKSYLTQRLQEIKELNLDEVMDLVTRSLKRYPILMEVKESYELLSRVVESLNRSSFLYEVRTHIIWSVLKKEILDHEFVVGIKQLEMITMEKVQELSADFYSYSLFKARELRDKAYDGFEQLKKNILSKNEEVKKAILKKRVEINLELQKTHQKLRSEGEQLLNKARGLYELGNQKLQETIQIVGEVSIHDIELRICQYVRNVLVPMKTAYTKLSKFVVAELLILDKHHREMQERVNVVSKSLIRLTNDIRNQYEYMSTKVSEWGLWAWTISKSEISKLEMWSAKMSQQLGKCSINALVVGQRLVGEYIPYKNLLKMTPNQIIEQLRAIDVKAQQLFKTVKTNTQVYIESLLHMIKELRESVDREKVQEIQEKMEKLLNTTRDQMHFLATEILETTVFVTKFYGSADTVYRAHPEMVQFANYQLQRFMNCSRICKTKAAKFYQEARDIFDKFFAAANYTYQNKLPQLIKYAKNVINDWDADSFEKMQNMVIEYMNISKDFAQMKYTEMLQKLELSKEKFQEYVKTKLSELMMKLKKTKRTLDKILKGNIQMKVNKIHQKLLIVLEDVKELFVIKYQEILANAQRMDKLCRTYMTKYVDVVSDLPALAKNAVGKLPLILDMIKRDLKILLNDTIDKLYEGKLYIQDEVIPIVKKTCIQNVNTLKKHLNQLKDCSNDMINSIKNDFFAELPIVKEKILKIVDIMKKTEIDLNSAHLELKLPRLDELRVILSDLNTMVTKKYGVIYSKFDRLYQNSKENSKEILERIMKDAKTNIKYLREEIPKFCESKITELHEFAQPKLTSLSRSADKALQELQKLRKEAKDYYEEKKLMLFSKRDEVTQMVHNYVKMLLETSKDISEEMKKQLSEMKFETKQKVEHLKRKASQIKNELKKAAGENQNQWENRMKTLFNQTEIERFISKYIDLEDLKNKTIEIKEDILNMSLVRDLVDMGESFYMEGQRLFYLAKETSEFTLYVMKRVVKYSDVWEIVEELTNPFHWIPPSNSIAMIFGKPHVYTFDGQSYQFVGYKKPSCTYVLAHDFRDNNFTLMSQEKALIVNTKSGFIKIHESGNVEATVSKDADGKEVKISHNELPVEMMQMTVKREGSFIKIKHDTGLDIVCDVKHFLCTFDINKFYHGKLAGLLGTNNNEQYDEFLKPDKTIAKSMIEFANAWEVSGDPECKVTGTERKPTCEKQPSVRCDELFLSKSSPLAPYFKTVDPEPFYDACRFDTSDCKTNAPPSESFCNVTAAYTALLREKGVWARQLHECVSCGSKGVWQKWTERGSKNVDVVLLIPETLKMDFHAHELPSFLKELENDLSMYRSRYAVVGFGGKTDLHRRPHTVTVGGRIFGDIKDVQSAISNMKFTTGTVNTLEAIEYLTHLPFLPGASKVVIMIMDQKRQAMSGVSLQNAMKELDMQGVIFNVIGPYFQKKQHKNVLGMWKGQAITRKDKFQNKLNTIGLPVNDYTRLAESSLGGIFNLKSYSQPRGDWTSLLKRAMKKTIVKQIDEDQTYCRQCVCIPSLTTEPVTLCRINRHSRCS